MNPGLEIYPTGTGVLLAAAAVVVGAPLFSDGLRALRLRRHFAALRKVPLGDGPTGFVHVRGTVGLESPMFAPLSGSPCAGFRLEVRAAGTQVTRVVDQRRPFRLCDGGVVARVLEGDACWDLSVTAERSVAADQPLSEHLSALLQRLPEVALARRAGRSLHLVERALRLGAECHVVGCARRARPLDLEPEMELLRTGTDDAPAAVMVPGESAARAEPDLWIGGDEHLDFLLVTDHAPGPARVAMPAHRLAGVVLGPALTMAGLLYLASALDTLRAVGHS